MKQKIVIAIILGVMLLGAGLYGLYHQRIGQFRPYFTTNIHISGFSEDYVREHRDQVVIETRPGFELVQVLLALAGDPYDRSVNKDSAYYDALMRHFEPYKNHQAVDDFQVFMNNNSLPSAAMLFAYDIVDGDLVFKDEHESNTMHRFDTIIPELNRFIEASDFESYYADYLTSFQPTINDYPVDTKAMWAWLEARGEDDYDVLRIVSSPLINQHHYTHRFRDHAHGGFEEMVAFVPILYTGQSQLPFDEAQTATLFLSQYLFTEIAHHYVNPITDQHLYEVFQLLDDPDAWYDGPGYHHAGLIFNEYMTWALFTHYVHDAYDQHTAEVMKQVLNDVMVNHREFHDFDRFNDHLYDHIKTREQTSMLALYDYLFDTYHKP